MEGKMSQSDHVLFTIIKHFFSYLKDRGLDKDQATVQILNAHFYERVDLIIKAREAIYGE